MPLDDPWLSEDDKIVQEAQKRFRTCEEWEGTAWTNFDYDYKFANADSVNMYQWDNWVVGDRIELDRPCLTINKTMQHNLMIINDGKQNKPGVNIRPVGEDASFEAAQIFEEIIRHIEYMSNAENIYDRASEFQVIGGIGYWRIIVDWVDPSKGFEQEIYLKGVKHPKSIRLDPNINETDGSDARFGFIFNDMPRDLYDTDYPDFKDVGGSTVLNGSAEGWFSNDHVRIVEYFRKNPKKDKWIEFVLPETQAPIKGYYSELKKSNPDAIDAYEAIKYNEKRLPFDEQTFQERTVTTNNVEWFKIAGNVIIDKKPWLGKYIPIIRIVGIETVIDGQLDRKGHTRALLDPQRIYNINSPLALNTPLPTPNGWTTMGEVKAGDMLFDEIGNPVKVEAISPIFINRDCYKVNFDDGSSIIADADHLWTVEEREKIKTYNWTWPVKNIKTKDLTPNKHFIYAHEGFELEEKELLIHPYLLGVWLGDGDTAGPRFTSSKDDVENMRLNIASCGYNVGEARINKYNAVNFTVHGTRWKFYHLGLVGNKHIPNDYLRASYDQRLELLQGLMDTDGCYSAKFNRCIFTNTNMKLIDDFIELIRSLGIRFTRQNVAATSRMFPNGEIYNCVPATHISFTIDPETPVFKLKRKLEPQTKNRVVHKRRSKRHKILSVEKIASVPVKCVCINSKSHLFLAGEGMIPTHNSANVEFGALQTKSPFRAAADAIEGYEDYYKLSNLNNAAVLLYNAFDDEGRPLPPPDRLPPPQSSPAYVQQMQIAQNEMMMVSGQWQAQMGEQENAKSGVAINQRQRQGDRATYHFPDGQAIGIRYTGKQFIDLIPKIYNKKRVQRIEAKDGTILNITIDPNHSEAMTKVPVDPNQPQNPDAGIDIIFNPNVGNYAVVSDTGPSFATRRQEAFNALTQIAAQNKEFMNVGGDLLWKVADFPEAQELARRWRRIIPPNITGDAPNPQLTQAMHQASDKIEQQLAIITKQTKELADKDRELDLKEREILLREKEAIARENRADYDAENKRLTALGNSGPAITPEQIQPVVQSLLRGMLKAGELDPLKLAMGIRDIDHNPAISLPPEDLNGGGANNNSGPPLNMDVHNQWRQANA